MSEGEVEIESPQAWPVLPKDITEEIGSGMSLRYKVQGCLSVQAAGGSSSELFGVGCGGTHSTLNSH